MFESAGETWWNRVIVEKRELDHRLTKLRAFLTTSSGEITVRDHELLMRQVRAMQTYSNILGERLSKIDTDSKS